MTHTLCFLIGLTLGALVAFVAMPSFAGKLHWLLGFHKAEDFYSEKIKKACAENVLLKRQLSELSTQLTDCQWQRKRDVKLLHDAFQNHAQVRGLNDRAGGTR